MARTKDQAYWDNFMRRQPRNASMLASVPPQYRSAALCEWLMAHCGENAGFVRLVPEAAFTRALAEQALQRSATLFEHIPARLIDKALCMAARIGDHGFDLAHVPAEVIDRELCEHALQCGASLADVPPALLDKAMCMVAVTLGRHGLDDLPAALVDDELVAAAIAHGSYDSFNEDLPELFKSPAYLIMAIAHDKRALDAIPGKRMTQDVVDSARRRYGSDADWPAIVARHDESRMARMVREARAVYADVCWSVFWTAPMMLAQIAHPADEGLRPFEIPAERFTKAVAQACVDAHPSHLPWVPPQWIDQAMCEQVSRAHPDWLDQIPLAMRSGGICARAVLGNGTTLGMVPLERRTVALCVAVLLANQERADQVPRRQRREVFDTLAGQHRSHFYAGWLYLKRGDAALCSEPPRIDLALADYRLVAASGVGAEVLQEQVDEALRMIGYCRYLQGDMALVPPDEFLRHARLRLREAIAPADVDMPRFYLLLSDAQAFNQRGDHARALLQARRAAALLAAAGCAEPAMLARVADQERLALNGIGEREQSDRLCRHVIDTLGDAPMYADTEACNPLRAALRACYLQLAGGLVAAGATPAALEAALALLERGAAIENGHGEDDDVARPLIEQRVALLAPLAAQDPAFHARYQGALDQLAALPAPACAD